MIKEMLIQCATGTAGQIVEVIMKKDSCQDLSYCEDSDRWRVEVMVYHPCEIKMIVKNNPNGTKIIDRGDLTCCEIHNKY